MSAIRTAGVIDIGKTNAKVALVDVATRQEVAVRTTPNMVAAGGPYPHHDLEGIWAFVIDALAALNAEQAIEAISVTTHGAAAALIDEAGRLALPVMDYEYDGPDEFAAAYDAARPCYMESFTPRLPGGLNLGAQIYYQSRYFPESFARVSAILTYPQYFGFRLTGTRANEITSLGCHTDLWNIAGGHYSSLVTRQGWEHKLPAVTPTGAVLGPLHQDLARHIGLKAPIPVHNGIHDSNASLLPHLIGRAPPFAVVSTGTWVIVTAPGAPLGKLDAARDCLANVDAFGRPVPSARFMGGREFSTLVGRDPPEPSEAALGRVLDQTKMLLPSVVPGSGPFPRSKSRWSHDPESLTPEERLAIVSLYLAMMTAECLGLAGAGGDVVVEGPFAGNAAYLAMLAVVAGRPVRAMRSSATGTSIGAALLTGLADAQPIPVPEAVAVPPALAPAMARYAGAWRGAVATGRMQQNPPE